MVGDEVWVLAGSTVPAVLRPRREEQEGGQGFSTLSGREMAHYYELFRLAYVHGIMEGEAVAGEKGEWRDLILE